MKKEALTTAMKTSISEVLETMFFLPIDFAEGETTHDFRGKDEGRLTIARIAFKGSISGHLEFMIPKELARSITASFLGQAEEDISTEHANDTVKEIINMVAGNAFSHYDNQTVFDISIPEIITPNSKQEPPSQSDPESIFIGINTLDSQFAFEMMIEN